MRGIRRSAEFVRARVPGAKPAVGIILGSGLSNAVPPLSGATTIPYSDIPGFPRTTVSGHAGRLILGRQGGISVAVMQGRFHYYEGHSMESIALPVRVLEYLGHKTLIVTSAVGSMRSPIKPGQFVLVRDHINLMGRNPLRAFHEEEFGEMFPDLSDAYDPELRLLAAAACRKRRIPVHEGVYVAVGGPSYETPAEINAFRRLGGSVIGMSVVPEVIVARQMGLRVLAISWISNMASGMKGAALSHPDVLALGDRVAGNLSVVLQDVVKRL
ncbi:MAG: purine-nucleoside phosphorylase [Elusimicrobia bacterium]|nr:purine-nucleoside phosphorylase [Elusimicrobiota bacterium]